MTEKVTIDDLPNEILLMILERVEIAWWPSLDQWSTIKELNQCPKCWYSSKKCVHIHPDEIHGIKNLALVCKRWKHLLNRYKFKYLQ